MNIKELFNLTGKTAVVTGGYTGIGKQMALGLAEAGADVAVCARNLDGCEKTAREIAESTGVKTLALKCDVSSEADVVKTVADTVKKFGGLDILVNNAGIAMGGLPEDTKLEDWDKILDVNLTGTFLCAREAAKVMIKAGGGKIINISSVMGYQTTSVVSAPAYVASKGAVVTLTKDLAIRWIKHGINVNAIAPGWFPTNMTEPVLSPEFMNMGKELLTSIPAGRFGGEDDLKGVTVLLASRASDYITGEVIVVDGGTLSRY
ncbi:MAG TPA: glucose 1-dehydrogenase [Thermodesulfobacteriota bacterium]|nr:glucose 1-dehydrogenase [Thermodesulfobacteriota bacterium]